MYVKLLWKFYKLCLNNVKGNRELFGIYVIKWYVILKKYLMWNKKNEMLINEC